MPVKSMFPKIPMTHRQNSGGFYYYGRGQGDRARMTSLSPPFLRKKRHRIVPCLPYTKSDKYGKIMMHSVNSLEGGYEKADYTQSVE